MESLSLPLTCIFLCRARDVFVEETIHVHPLLLWFGCPPCLMSQKRPWLVRRPWILTSRSSSRQLCSRRRESWPSRLRICRKRSESPEGEGVSIAFLLYSLYSSLLWVKLYFRVQGMWRWQGHAVCTQVAVRKLSPQGRMLMSWEIWNCYSGDSRKPDWTGCVSFSPDS